MAKVYWVNSATKEISEVECNSLEDMRRLVGGHITLAHQTFDGDVLYVDDEGLLKENLPVFLYYHRQDQVLCGNAILVGREVEGPQYPGGWTTLPPAINIGNFRRLIRFPVT